jgi:hypothetical protein
MIRIIRIEREFGCGGSAIRSMNMGLSNGQAGLDRLTATMAGHVRIARGLPKRSLVFR